jgi:GMP synthase PP-ATPase subunit
LDSASSLVIVARRPFELLGECSRRVVNQVTGVSRLVHEISG